MWTVSGVCLDGHCVPRVWLNAGISPGTQASDQMTGLESKDPALHIPICVS